MAYSSSSNEGVVEGSELGRREHWEETYELELRNLRDNGDEGELWFGEDVMETMLTWTIGLLGKHSGLGVNPKEASILDIGTGNGVLPLELACQGYANVTGSDYSEASIELARAVGARRGISSVRWVVDDVLHSGLTERYDLVTDKGTLDAIGLSEDATANRLLYIEAVAKLLKPSGLLVITSCNSTSEELAQEFCSAHDGAGCEQPVADCLSLDQQTPQKSFSSGDADVEAFQRQDADASRQAALQSSSQNGCGSNDKGSSAVFFEYIDHVRTYPVFRFGGIEGSKVCTVAFRRTSM